MRRLSRTALVALVVWAVAGLAVAARPPKDSKMLLFTDGRKMLVASYDVQGTMTRIHGLDGQVFNVRTSTIDLPASRTATLKLHAPPPKPTPTPRKKTLIEAANEEAARRRRRGRRKTPTPEPTAVLPTPPPRPRQTPTPPPTPVPQPTVAAATTPPPTPVPSITPPPLPAGSQAGAPAPPADEGSLLPWLVGGVLLVGLMGAGGFVALKRRAASPAPVRTASPAAAAATAADDEAIFEPAFADEEEPAPSVSEGAQAVPAVPVEEAATAAPEAAEDQEPDQLSLPAPSVLSETGELQIRIGSDIYTCPDLSTLKQWIVEGRVLENSEILSPEGQWLLAGTIPDLEDSFEAKNWDG